VSWRSQSFRRNKVKKAILGTGVLCAALFGAQSALAARDYISIVGSSTVFPFSKVVAERFGKSTDFPTPKVESTGTGGGFKEFCKGVGERSADITNASRKIKQSEIEQCAANGVDEIVEVLIGYDGIVVANSTQAKQLNLQLKDLYLALAKQVPNPDGSETLIPNPYKKWSDIDKSLPNTKIEVLGPPPTSGTRDAFVELAMEGGCKKFDWIKELKSTDKSRYKAICHIMREDGAYIDAGENDNLIVQKLDANPDVLGIFGFSFLDQNADKVQPSLIQGVAPTFDTIAEGDYLISRPLLFYVKKDHVGVIPGMREFLAEFTSEKAWGEFGYLSEKGMIPLSEAERKKVGKRVKELETL
jgi:phosphate transport system substrate-binding protein